MTLHWTQCDLLEACALLSHLVMKANHHHHNRFTALFLGPPRWAGARTELLDFMVQRQINRGTHSDHPAGRQSIQTNQCPHPPSPPYKSKPSGQMAQVFFVIPVTKSTAKEPWRELKGSKQWLQPAKSHTSLILSHTSLILSSLTPDGRNIKQSLCQHSDASIQDISHSVRFLSKNYKRIFVS